MTWLRRPNKFGAVKTTVDGERFDSKHEAARWRELVLLQRAGEIQCLERQVRYLLVVNGVQVTSYRPDFCYVVTATGEAITEDAKAGPTKTEAYLIRRKLMQALHSIVITEV